MLSTLIPIIGAVGALAQSASDTAILDAPRTNNVLANITAMYPFPNTTTGAGFNTSNVQGDILVGMKKQLEVFYFYHINNPTSFKNKTRTKIVPRVTSTWRLTNYTTQPQVMLNMGFSATGLSSLDSSFHIDDGNFNNGQFADAASLGDDTNNWVDAFKGTSIHGVFLMASDNQTKINAQVNYIEQLYGTDITKIYSLQGNIRPPPFAGHEMFGYMDGIAQPAVNGFNLNPASGQEVVDPGVIIMNHPGDTAFDNSQTRPDWQTDGTMMVFRQLKQLVPEFNKFVEDNAVSVPGLTQQENIDLTGARLVGRWKSGAPVDLSPLRDNATLALSPANNNFDFSHAGFDIASDQSHCPFGAHIRKARPRGDFTALGIEQKSFSIMRAGIPYGPEVTATETNSNASSSDLSMERGLAFVGYQSIITQGFGTIQSFWTVSDNFPFAKNQTIGEDAIIGQAQDVIGGPRHLFGIDPTDATKELIMPNQFVVSRGGEYFFVPSISALATTLTA